MSGGRCQVPGAQGAHTPTCAHAAACRHAAATPSAISRSPPPSKETPAVAAPQPTPPSATTLEPCLQTTTPPYTLRLHQPERSNQNTHVCICLLCTPAPLLPFTPPPPEPGPCTPGMQHPSKHRAYVQTNQQKKKDTQILLHPSKPTNPVQAAAVTQQQRPCTHFAAAGAHASCANTPILHQL